MSIAIPAAWNRGRPQEHDCSARLSTIATGTMLMNCCDDVDPSLAPTGVKSTPAAAPAYHARLGFEASFPFASRTESRI
jgi:hypothetical protein